MSIALPRPISDQTKTCLRHFRVIEGALKQPQSSDSLLSVSLFSNELDRFMVWASNVGAVFEPSRKDVSLDLRLIKAPEVADHVLQFLQSLEKELIGGINFSRPFELLKS